MALTPKRTATATLLEPLPYLSSAWAEVARQLVEESPRFAEITRGVHASLLTLVSPRAPTANEAFLIEFEDGEITNFYSGPRAGLPAVEPTFTITAEYDTLAQIHKGELGELRALLSGKVKLKGSKLAALRHLKTIEQLNELVRDVPTKF